MWKMVHYYSSPYKADRVVFLRRQQTTITTRVLAVRVVNLF